MLCLRALLYEEYNVKLKKQYTLNIEILKRYIFIQLMNNLYISGKLYLF